MTEEERKSNFKERESANVTVPIRAGFVIATVFAGIVIIGLILAGSSRYLDRTKDAIEKERLVRNMTTKPMLPLLAVAIFLLHPSLQAQQGHKTGLEQ